MFTYSFSFAFYAHSFYSILFTYTSSSAFFTSSFLRSSCLRICSITPEAFRIGSRYSSALTENGRANRIINSTFFIFLNITFAYTSGSNIAIPRQIFSAPVLFCFIIFLLRAPFFVAFQATKMPDIV